MTVNETINELLAELETLNPKCRDFVLLFRSAKVTDQILVAKSLDIDDKEEEVLMQKLVDLLEPMSFTGSELEKVRMEMQALEAAGKEIQDPQEEEMWEKKLQEARQKDFENTEKIKKDRLDGISAPKKENENVDGLSDIKGLGETTIEKLNAAGIRTAKEFYALSFDQKQNIVGPLVAARFKD